MNTPRDATLNALLTACRRARIDASGAELIRFSENAIYRLPKGVVARVPREGRLQTAAKEVRVARWLETVGVPAVQVVPDLDQPVEADGRAVTFWRELPPHEYGTSVDVAAVLRVLHGLTPPARFELPPLAPFVRLAQRIDQADMFTSEERDWLRERLEHLEHGYAELPQGLPHCVVHGGRLGRQRVVDRRRPRGCGRLRAQCFRTAGVGSGVHGGQIRHTRRDLRSPVRRVRRDLRSRRHELGGLSRPALHP
ncbi:hypothetical protein GCM10018952_67460 [Streptosporangium vulgare]